MKNKNVFWEYHIQIHNISINIKAVLLAIVRNTIKGHPERSFFTVYLHLEYQEIHDRSL